MEEYLVKTDSQVGQLLESFRKERGLTQAALAKRLGVSQQTYSQLERNTSAASLGRVLAALSQLGVELVLRDTKGMLARAPSSPSNW